MTMEIRASSSSALLPEQASLLAICRKYEYKCMLFNYLDISLRIFLSTPARHPHGAPILNPLRG